MCGNMKGAIRWPQKFGRGISPRRLHRGSFLLYHLFYYQTFFLECDIRCVNLRTDALPSIHGKTADGEDTRGKKTVVGSMDRIGASVWRGTLQPLKKKTSSARANTELFRAVIIRDVGHVMLPGLQHAFGIERQDSREAPRH